MTESIEEKRIKLLLDLEDIRREVGILGEKYHEKAMEIMTEDDLGDILDKMLK